MTEIFLSSLPLDRFYLELDHLDVTLISGAAVSIFDSITLPSLSQPRVHYKWFNNLSAIVLRSACTCSVCASRSGISTMRILLRASSLCGVILGESAGLSRNLVLMMHPSPSRNSANGPLYFSHSLGSTMKTPRV